MKTDLTKKLATCKKLDIVWSLTFVSMFASNNFFLINEQTWNMSIIKDLIQLIFILNFTVIKLLLKTDLTK